MKTTDHIKTILALAFSLLCLYGSGENIPNTYLTDTARACDSQGIINSCVTRQKPIIWIDRIVAQRVDKAKLSKRRKIPAGYIELTNRKFQYCTGGEAQDSVLTMSISLFGDTKGRPVGFKRCDGIPRGFWPHITSAVKRRSWHAGLNEVFLRILVPVKYEEKISRLYPETISCQ